MKAEVARLEAQLKDEKSTAGAQAKPENANRRALATDQTLMSARSELEALTSSTKTRVKAQEQIEAEIRAYQQKVKLAPLREQQFMDLTRDYGNAKANYESLLVKKNLSDLASNLEKRQQGEQFRVLDPANLPNGPTSPKRPLIAGAGSVFRLLIGIAIILL